MIPFPGIVSEEFGFNDSDSGEELNRRTDPDSECVEELHCVDEFAGLWEIGYDFGVCAIAECGIAEEADGCEDKGYEEHY